ATPRRIDLRIDAQQLDDPAGEPGLLLEFADRGVRRTLAELDAAARQRPQSHVELAGAEAGQQHTSIRVLHDAVRGDPGEPVHGHVRHRTHGRSSAARYRGSRTRSGGAMSAITDENVWRRSGLPSSRRTA